MSNAQPTPGPWTKERSWNDRDLIDIPLKAIHCERLGFSVSFVNGHREQEAEANARLIASAPELLEALKIAQKFMSIASDWNVDEAEIDGQMRSTYEWLDVVSSAIAKATGERA